MDAFGKEKDDKKDAGMFDFNKPSKGAAPEALEVSPCPAVPGTIDSLTCVNVFTLA